MNPSRSTIAGRRRISLRVLVAVAIGASLGAVSCKGKPPTAPTRVPTPDPPRVTVAGTIQGVLIPGDSVQLSATYRPTGGPVTDRTSDAAWVSSDNTVVTVSSSGLATARGIGSANVTATVDSVSGTVSVTVFPSRERLTGHMDPTIAADVIAFNQQANSNPRKGTIMRWQPPMPVFIDSSMGSRRTCVIRALDIWQGATGIPYVLLDSDIAPAPRVKVYATYLPDNRPRTWIESTNLDNSKRLESVIWGEDWPNRCDPSAYWFTTYVHELGHALGVHGHIPNETTCVMSYERDHSLGPQPCEREIRLLTELYKLPLGAHVEPDGTWVR